MRTNKISTLNRNLKKAIGLALLIALFGGSIITLSSCYSNGNGNYSADRLTAAQRADIEQAGTFHAKALDAIITDFMRERVRVFHESAHQAPGLRSTTVAHVCFEQVALSTTKRLMKEWELVQDEQQAQALMSELMPVARQTRASMEPDVVRQLTPFQTEYYHRLMSIIERSDVMNELDPLLREIAALEVQIEQHAPTTEEAMPLFYAASVARHAATYWNESRKRWFTILFSEIVDIVPVDEVAEGLTLRTVGTSPLTRSSCCCLFILFPDPNSHSHFFKVTPQGTFRMECPGELVFCSGLQTCVYPFQVICGSGQGVGNEHISAWQKWLGCAGTTIGGAMLGIGIGIGQGFVKGLKPGAILGGVFGGVGGAIAGAGTCALAW